MSFDGSYNKLEELYKSHLPLVGDVKFTFREVDILVCILHGRKEKKIASILAISPRTVSSHVHNIMQKLACNAKDQIIDFIENSGMLPIFKEYYLHLQIKSHFEQQLTHIGNRINRNTLTCYCYRSDLLSIDTNLYQAIEAHLKLANIVLLQITANKNDNSIEDKNETTLPAPIFEISKISEANYYHDLLQNLLLVIDFNEKDKILEEFNSKYQKLEDAYSNKVEIWNVIEEENIDSENNEDKRSFWLNLSKTLPYKFKTAILFAIILFALFVGLMIKQFFWDSKKNSNYPNDKKLATTSATAPEIIQDLEEFLESTKNHKLSSDHTSSKQIQQNHSLVKKIEKILDYSNIKEVQEYLNKAEMSAEILTHYLYDLQALASYYVYNMHDGVKADQILRHGKKLAEHYVNIRSKGNNDFDSLSPEEILAELSIVEDLPQIYTRIIYSLGRTYFYRDKAVEGKKYFELAKHLGNKLNLFEGYLSDISGILIIEIKNVDFSLKNNNTEQATKTLHYIIQSYTDLQQYDKPYINNYKPGLIEQETIIPTANFYNLFECGTRIIACYTKLIEISHDQGTITSYTTEITKHLQGSKVQKGLLQIIDKIPDKKQADLYNKLGDLYLILWRQKTIENIAVDDGNLTQIIAAALPIDNSNNYNKHNSHKNLFLAEKLFTLARNKSRNSYFTKEIAYRGLIKVYQRMLEHINNMPVAKIQELKERITAIEDKLKLIDIPKSGE